MSSATITTSARLMNSTPQTEEQAMVRKVAVSSFLGNFIEWFDYASYSYFATTIALVFFPTDNHTVAMLQTFGVFALSFILRPIGALFWGSYGDKKGRKAALAHSIMFMSGASFLIGCLPSYSVIGVGAPILLLLLRMVQGFSASGEYAGAATFLGEYAPTSKRGIYCSLIPASTAIGLLAGSTLATLMATNMNSSAMVGWGWRVPFLLAGPLGLIVLYIRAKLADSPVYQSMNDALESKGAASADGQIAAKSGMFAPLAELFHNHLKALIISFGACVLNAVGFYTVLTYLPTYLSDTVGMDAPQSGTITTICLVAYVFMVFGMGHISDKFGRKKVLIGACVAFIVEAIDLVTRETGGVATIVETNWWDPVPQSVIDKVFDGLVFPGWALEHAAVTETSLMLHYAPELVHMDRMVEEAGATAKSYVRYPVRQGDVPAHGGLANPAGSSAERGRLIAEACVDAVAEICAEEFGE